MNIKIISVIAIIAIVTVLVFQITGNFTAKQEVIRIGYLQSLVSLQLFVADENKYLESEGIKYELVKMGSSNQLIESLLSNNIDLAFETSFVPVLAAESQSPGDIKIFSISDLTIDKPFDSIITKGNSDIRTLNDLENKKIGVFPGTTSTHMLTHFLESKGIDTKEIEFVQLPPQNHLEALEGGSIDALFSFEPNTAIAINKLGAKRVYNSVFAEQINHNPQGVAVFSTRFVKENPELAKSIVVVFDKSVEFIRTREAETRQIISKRLDIDTEIVESMTLFYMVKNNEINKNKVQKYIDFLFELKEIEERIDVDHILY